MWDGLRTDLEDRMLVLQDQCLLQASEPQRQPDANGGVQVVGVLQRTPAQKVSLGTRLLAAALEAWIVNLTKNLSFTSRDDTYDETPLTTSFHKSPLSPSRT
jgi:hypothetical protein